MVFVPGLKDKRLIGHLCALLKMPANIMLGAPMTPIDLQTGCNLARISFGTLGYQLACKDLATRFGAALMMCLACSRGLKTGQCEKTGQRENGPK